MDLTRPIPQLYTKVKKSLDLKGLQFNYNRKMYKNMFFLCIQDGRAKIKKQM